MDCGKQCMRILMFVFNFIFFALGLVLLGVGAYSRIKSKDYDSVLGGDGTILSAANLLIASGVLVAIIGFLGCFGACTSSKILLGIFAALIILVFIVEIAGGILAYTKRDSVKKNLKEGLDKLVTTNYKFTPDPKKPEEKVVKDGLDFFQKTIACCGTNTSTDWVDSPWQKDSLNQTAKDEKYALVPDSCCKKPGVENSTCNYGSKTNPTTSIEAMKEINQVGCWDQGFAWLKSRMWQIGGAAIGVAITQLFGIVFAICLINAIRKDDGDQ